MQLSHFYFVYFIGIFCFTVYTMKTKPAFLLQARIGACDTGCGKAWSSMAHAILSLARAPRAAPHIPNNVWVGFHAESVWAQRSYTKILSLFISAIGVWNVVLNFPWSTWNRAITCPYFCHIQSDWRYVFVSICDFTDTRRQHKIILFSKL